MITKLLKVDLKPLRPHIWGNSADSACLLSISRIAGTDKEGGSMQKDSGVRMICRGNREGRRTST